MHCDHRTETESDESDCSSLDYVRFEKEDGQQAPTESSLIISEDELLLTSGKDVDDVEELLDARLLFAVEYAFVEEVQRVAGSPFERENFCMLEESRHIFPRFPVVFQLLQESTHANDNMLAFDILIADSIELENVAPLYRSLNLKRLEKILTKQLMHLLDIVLVSCNACAERCFEKRQEEAHVDVMIELQDVLQDVGAGVKEQFDHCSILAIVMLEVHQAIEESEEELVQALDPRSVILGLYFIEFLFEQ